MEKRRTHVVIPEVLVAEIDAVVGKRGRSQFLVQAATFEIKRRRQQAALKQALGAWKAEDHPELKGNNNKLADFQKTNGWKSRDAISR